MDIYATNMRRNNRQIELTNDLENGPYFYGNIFTVWIKYLLNIDAQERRGDVGRQTAKVWW